MKQKSLFDRLKKDMQKEGWSPRHVTAMVVFGAIVIVFVFFGYSGRHNRIGTGSAAQVNNTLLSVSDLRTESERLERMYAPMFGGQISGEAQRQFLRQQALENLIAQELMAQGASKLGVRVSDEEIRDVITKDIPAFQDKGRFQHERYLNIMAANHWTAGEFEGRIRKERSSQRLQRAMEAASSPLDLELKRLKEMRENKRDVLFAKIDRTQVLEKMPISDADLKNALANADLQKKVEDEFQRNKIEYATPEEVHAAHILIKANPADPESKKAALEKIQAIKKRAEKEDFGKLAAELSEDLGSKTTKGDLGTFGHGKMVPEFEKAAFAQKPGVVGEPVETNFGYHLIKVIEHKPASEPTLDAVRSKITRKMLANEKYDAVIKGMEEALAKGDGAAVEKGVKDLGLSMEDSGFFDLGTDMAPKIGSAQATQLAMTVSEKQPWPKKLAREGTALYVVKWKADKKEVSTDNGKVEEQLARERTYDMMNSWVENLRKSATIERNSEASANSTQ